MNIDVDGHIMPVEVLENVPKDLKDAPHLVTEGEGSQFVYVRYPTIGDKKITRASTDLEMRARIDAMREGGVDKQCLLIQNGTIPYPFLESETYTYLCRRWNEAVRKICKEYDCFVGIAQIPHHDVNAAVKEAERAVRELGFRAVEIYGRWADGSNVESPAWFPFFDSINRMGVPLWFHPGGKVTSNKYNPMMPASDVLKNFPAYINSLMGFLLHAQLLSAGLVFGGVFDRFPNLKVVLCECDAGWAPSFMDWIDSIYDAALMRKQQGFLKDWVTNPDLPEIVLRKRPSQYIRDHFYFAITSTEGYSLSTILPFLVNKIGLEGNLVIETDYEHAEGSLDIARRVRKLDSISEEAKDKICGKNAADLLKLEWAPSVYAWA